MSAASDRRQDGASPTPDVLGELNAVRAAVRGQLGELIDALDGDGGAYADRYAEWMAGRQARHSLKAPPAPPALRGAAALLVREMVRDELTTVRVYGRAQRRAAAAAAAA